MPLCCDLRAKIKDVFFSCRGTQVAQETFSFSSKEASEWDTFFIFAFKVPKCPSFAPLIKETQFVVSLVQKCNKEISY